MISSIFTPLRVIAALAIIAILVCIYYPWSQVVAFMDDLHKVMIPPVIVIGAVWALFRFGCGYQAAIEIRLNASQEVLPNDDSLYISAEVEISNHGSRTARLPYHDSNPFRLYRITFNEKGGQSIDCIKDIPSVYLKSEPDKLAVSTIVRAQTTERLPFFTQVPGPGLYLFTFCTDLPENEEAKSRKTGAEAWVKWAGATHVIVKQSG